MQGIVIGVIAGLLVAGGVAFAYVVPKIDPSPTDRYYACVSAAGKVKPATMKLNVEPTGCPIATDTIRSWNAQGPQGDPGPAGLPGPLRPVTLVTGDQQLVTTATDYVNTPGVSAVVDVASDDTMLLIEISGVLGCASSSAPSDGDGCMSRILVDGQPANPQLGPEGYMMSRELPDTWSGGGYNQRASAVVDAGLHTVQFQWRVYDIAPLGDGATWYLNFWTLSVEQFAAQ